MLAIKFLSRVLVVKNFYAEKETVRAGGEETQGLITKFEGAAEDDSSREKRAYTIENLDPGTYYSR